MPAADLIPPDAWTDTGIEALRLPPGRHAALAHALLPPGEVHHWMLGNPLSIQNPMQIQCQLASNGIYCGGPDAYHGPRYEQLAPGAADWRLLLQLDSDDDAGIMWGTTGRLYVWIREQDLRERRWGAAWVILQCS